MRKALVTLFGASLLGAILIPSCVIKQSDDDSASDKGGAAAGGSVGLDGTGGTNAASGGASDGGATSSGTTITLKEACPDLEITNGNGDVCSSTTMAASYNDIHMLIVLDKSGSMNTKPDGFSDTKWEATKTALSEALESSAEQVRYGLLMYPYSTGTVAIPATNCGARCCELATSSADAVNVPVGDAKTSVPEIVAKLGDTEPSGGTPTAAALKAAYEYYVTGSGALLAGDKYVLLATDGAPNCNEEHEVCDAATCTANIDAPAGSSCGGTIANCCEAAYASSGAGPSACIDDASVLEQIKALADAGVKTFVVGIPGTENYKAYLTKFAEMGGAPDPKNPTLAYYEVSASAGVAGLTTTFKSITETLVRDCDIKLDKAPLDVNRINVAVECTALPMSAGDVINWEYNGDANDPTITIKGTTCDTIEAQGVTRVDVIEGCTTIILT